MDSHSESSRSRRSASTPAAIPRPDRIGVDASRGDVDALAPGDILDAKYRLIVPLASGGMGSLWRAHNELLDKEVAIKVIRADVLRLLKTKRQMLLDRFRQEARASARLGHPAIVTIHDFGTTERGEPYLVMELLEGEDLGTALDRRGRIHPVKALRALLPIAHGLAAAHRKGIVHRDIKPENIFFSRGGGGVQPKLIDFGIAKLEVAPSARISSMGVVMGTPDYNSPEQARGDEADHRSDIWSFCTVLYESLAGERPFAGETRQQRLRAILDDEPAPLDASVVDEELAAIIVRGLAKDPKDRWQSMDDLGTALAGWLLRQGVTEDLCHASLRRMWLQQRDEMHSLLGVSIPPPPELEEVDVDLGKVEDSFDRLPIIIAAANRDDAPAPVEEATPAESSVPPPAGTKTRSRWVIAVVAASVVGIVVVGRVATTTEAEEAMRMPTVTVAALPSSTASAAAPSATASVSASSAVIASPPVPRAPVQALPRPRTKPAARSTKPVARKAR